MRLLDIFTRCIFIPSIWVFFFSVIITSIPEVKEDAKKLCRLFSSSKRKSRLSKRKTVRVYPSPKVIYPNSLSYSKLLNS